MRRPHLLLVGLLLAAACAPRGPQKPAGVALSPRQPADASGFLDDYSLLRPGGPDEVALVYRAPDASWTSYEKVLLEPVTLWRSGRKSLVKVPERDLLRLITMLQHAVRRRLAADFALVDRPEPGTMRVRLAITEARASDPILDVLRDPGRDDPKPGSGPLHPETKRFIQNAHIEGEIRDAATEKLLAAGVDRRRESAPALDTWADVDRAIDFWAERLCKRLEARTRRPR